MKTNPEIAPRMNRELHEAHERSRSIQRLGRRSPFGSCEDLSAIDRSSAAAVGRPFLCALCVLLWLTSATAATNYVWQDSPNPTPPYSSWEMAAHVIQDAVDAASAEDTVLVTNGVYRTGGRAVGTNTLVNRVAVDKPLILTSVNGPEVTIIEGYKVPPGGFGLGDEAIRCVYLSEGGTLIGFTLTNGATRYVGHPIEDTAGGVWCESTDALVFDCILRANIAQMGGGAYQGTLIDCTLTGNYGVFNGGGAAHAVLSNCDVSGNEVGFIQGCSGGGLYMSTAYNCTLHDNRAWYVGAGGGVHGGTYYNCTLTHNVARGSPDGGGAGGGAFDATLNNCTLRRNLASFGGGAAGGILNSCLLTQNIADSLFGADRGFGGGTYDSSLNNCTLIGNSAMTAAGGVARGSLSNCILYFNTATNQPNYDTNSTLNYTCTYPMPPNGVGNITNAPLFVDTNNWADLRLRSDSPCIDAGNNDYVTTLTDLDGKPRILNGIVDMGAYEFVPLTPAELVLHLAEMVTNSDLRQKRPLLASLEAALASIERGSHYSAMGQLVAFQNKVGAQVYRNNPTLAVELIEGAQKVMDALNDSP